ncbi:MAG: hypothetical protein JO228_09635 [Xanthobacteraceae bacterium]|nr:hypothetical protein [Xanthobacteraceae bacterium]
MLRALRADSARTSVASLLRASSKRVQTSPRRALYLGHKEASERPGNHVARTAERQ